MANLPTSDWLVLLLVFYAIECWRDVNESLRGVDMDVVLCDTSHSEKCMYNTNKVCLKAVWNVLW